eukprot:1125-Heterococcus_DN1.PRE.3
MSAASSTLPQRKSITKLTKSEANDLADAFRELKALPANDPDSFWTIAGYHGEPFPEAHPLSPGEFWGYCHHGTVLFPTWHRAYLHRIEAALKRHHRDPDNFALPYWDVIADHMPEILTKEPFDHFMFLDGMEVVDSNGIYTKRTNYVTMRFPFSGLQDAQNPQLAASASQHNIEMVKQYPTSESRAQVLRDNLASVLDKGIPALPDLPAAARAVRVNDRAPVTAQFYSCLATDSYNK